MKRFGSGGRTKAEKHDFDRTKYPKASEYVYLRHRSTSDLRFPLMTDASRDYHVRQSYGYLAMQNGF